MRSPLLRFALGAIGLVVVLAILRAKPWASDARRGSAGSGARETLKVGFLPVTCHLTCPVTDFATKTSHSTRFESQRFTDFPTVVETVKSGRGDATFMIAPLAMKLREQGLKVKITYLGHRDGSTVIVRKDLPATSLRDLRGKAFAIPSKYSNQNLVIRKLMKDEGVDPSGTWCAGSRRAENGLRRIGSRPRVSWRRISARTRRCKRSQTWGSKRASWSAVST